MLFKDCWVYSPRIDSSENLVWTYKCKKWDYTEWMKSFIFDCYNKWNTVDNEIVWLDDNPDKDIMIKLRWNLGALMNEYCQKVKINIESEKQVLYKRNGVTTRLDLTREQLESEIDKYRSGLYYDNF